MSELGAVAQAIRSARRPVEFDYSAKLTELLLLTGARTREVRLAQWDEVKELDGERPRIEVPADRMKRREAWTVLLSKQAVALLKEIRANAELYERVEPYIFFRYSGAGSGSVCSENSVNEFLERIGLHGSITGHGFRKLFSTAAHSFWMFAGPNRNKAIEHSLAHVNKDTVEGVYNRSDYFAERAILMQWWADHLDVLCSDQSARVIPFSKTA